MTKPSIEIKPEEFSHRASIYLLGVASACHVTPDEALKMILESVARHVMPLFPQQSFPSRLLEKEDGKGDVQVCEEEEVCHA